MAQVRVRAVANVMGLRRGDVGDVETGSVHVDAMINAGYLQVLEYLPDPEPRVPVARVAAARFAQPNSFGEATVVELPEVAPEPKEVTSGKPRKTRPRPSRTRSAKGSGPAGDASDGPDVQSSVGDGSSGQGTSAGGPPDGEAIEPS